MPALALAAVAFVFILSLFPTASRASQLRHHAPRYSKTTLIARDLTTTDEGGTMWTLTPDGSLANRTTRADVTFEKACARQGAFQTGLGGSILAVSGVGTNITTHIRTDEDFTVFMAMNATEASPYITVFMTWKTGPNTFESGKKQLWLRSDEADLYWPSECNLKLNRKFFRSKIAQSDTGDWVDVPDGTPLESVSIQNGIASDILYLLNITIGDISTPSASYTTSNGDQTSTSAAGTQETTTGDANPLVVGGVPILALTIPVMIVLLIAAAAAMFWRAAQKKQHKQKLELAEHTAGIVSPYYESRVYTGTMSSTPFSAVPFPETHRRHVSLPSRDEKERLILGVAPPAMSQFSANAAGPSMPPKVVISPASNPQTPAPNAAELWRIIRSVGYSPRQVLRPLPPMEGASDAASTAPPEYTNPQHRGNFSSM
ncbi:hypothetical protein BKA62DRAFT_239401 [Auriculariales sp. MPI-PUGE-AT-0066]|nr:hypothetical protein BKA62DRAFT_239401 [Auriculariales sp. MPI-PUGE-AT-0066]